MLPRKLRRTDIGCAVEDIGLTDSATQVLSAGHLDRRRWMSREPAHGVRWAPCDRFEKISTGFRREQNGLVSENLFEECGSSVDASEDPVTPDTVSQLCRRRSFVFASGATSSHASLKISSPLRQGCILEDACGQGEGMWCGWPHSPQERRGRDRSAITHIPIHRLQCALRTAVTHRH